MNTITIYQRGTDLRVVRGEHSQHVDAKNYKVTIFPDVASARAACGKGIVKNARSVLDALNLIAPQKPIICTITPMKTYRRGDRVAIINRTLSGKFIVESTNARVEKKAFGDMYQVRMGGDSFARFIDPAAQADPVAYVTELNRRTEVRS